MYEPFRTWFAWAAGTQREAVTAVGTADMAQLTDRANDQGVGEEEEEEEEEEEKADGKESRSSTTSWWRRRGPRSAVGSAGPPSTLRSCCRSWLLISHLLVWLVLLV